MLTQFIYNSLKCTSSIIYCLLTAENPQPGFKIMASEAKYNESQESSLSAPTTAKLQISDLEGLMENKYMFCVSFISTLLNPVCASPRYV